MNLILYNLGFISGFCTAFFAFNLGVWWGLIPIVFFIIIKSIIESYWEEGLD